MGAGRSTAIRDRLLTHGRAPDTPVAVVQHGTQPGQRLVKGRLGDLVELLERHEVRRRP
jgi:siroheme synthase